MKFSYVFLLLTTARGTLAALTASNSQPNLSTLLAPPLSNASVNATPPNPLQKRKSYHIPNSPTTLIFISYTTSRTLAPITTYQTLLTALNSIYHATILNHGDGLVSSDTVSWSYRDAIVSVENHGDDRTGQLTWSILADTILGVGTFLEQEKCWCGEWTVQVEGFGNIGIGYVGPGIGKTVGEMS